MCVCVFCVCVFVCVFEIFSHSLTSDQASVSQNVGMNQSDTEELNRCSMTMFFFSKP